MTETPTTCQCQSSGWCKTMYRPGIDPENKQARHMDDARYKECSTNPDCKTCWFDLFLKERHKAQGIVDHVTGVVGTDKEGLLGGPVEFVNPIKWEPGAGTELIKLLNHPAWKFLGIRVSKTCKCTARAIEMNEWGTVRCRENVNTIVNWLEEEHRNQEIKLPFIRTVAKKMVLMAIKEAEGKE